MRIDLPVDSAARSLRILDLQGRPVAHETVKSQPGKKVLIHRPKDSPGTFAFDSWWVRFDGADIPGCGWRAFRVESASSPDENRVVSQPAGAGDAIENDWLRLELAQSGCFNLTDKRNGRRFEGLHLFEDRGECGDAYFHVPPKQDRAIHGPRGDFAARIERGPVSSRIILDHTLDLPVSSDAQGRSEQTAPLRIETTAVLARNAPLVEIGTTVDNCVRNHRLRVLFPSGIDAERSVADMPFDLLERPIRPPDLTGWFERYYPNHPMRHFCAVACAHAGLAIATRGLPEYEVYDDPARTIAVTLLRTTMVHTPKLKECDPSQENTQQLGRQVFEYGIIPFGGPHEIAKVLGLALDFNLPLRAAQSGKQFGSLPLEASMLTVEPPLELSAVKRAENQINLLVRLWNTSLEEIEGRIHFGFPARRAWRTNLEEQRLEELAVREGTTLCFPARPRQIITIELEAADAPAAQRRNPFRTIKDVA
jgi:mannosylglycerate hydrolase